MFTWWPVGHSGTLWWSCRTSAMARRWPITSSSTGSTPPWLRKTKARRSEASRFVFKFVAEKVQPSVVHTLFPTFPLLQSAQDPLISTSLPVFDLIDAIAPGAVRWELVKQVERGMMMEDDKMDNAKYEMKRRLCLCLPLALPLLWLTLPIVAPCQVCCLLGPQDRCPRLRLAGRPGGGESKDGADAVCLPHGPWLEKGWLSSQDVNETTDDAFCSSHYFFIINKHNLSTVTSSDIAAISWHSYTRKSKNCFPKNIQLPLLPNLDLLR